jgi:hypothetical protein
MTKSKPIVNYDESKGYYVKVGESANVWPMNHPNPEGMVSNKSMIRTSKILRLLNDNEDPSFETENTVYVPMEK